MWKTARHARAQWPTDTSQEAAGAGKAGRCGQVPSLYMPAQKSLGRQAFLYRAGMKGSKNPTFLGEKRGRGGEVVVKSGSYKVEIAALVARPVRKALGDRRFCAGR